MRNFKACEDCVVYMTLIKACIVCKNSETRKTNIETEVIRFTTKYERSWLDEGVKKINKPNFFEPPVYCVASFHYKFQDKFRISDNIFGAYKNIVSLHHRLVMLFKGVYVNKKKKISKTKIRNTKIRKTKLRST